MKQDYYSVLARAVEAIDPPDLESRLAVYNRARHAMARAPLTLDEIGQQRLLLEAAIRRIEREIATGRGVSVPHEGTTGQLHDDVGKAVGRVSTNSAWRPGLALHLAIGGLVAVAISTMAFIGYRYWHKPVVEDVRALAQAPVPNLVRTKAVTPDEKPSYIFNRQLVYYRSIHPAGTIVIAKSQNFLYLVRPKTAATRYTIGVGTECSNVAGLLLVSAKEDWSAGGPEANGKDDVRTVRNAGGRFGARSLALSDSGYRIHGSDEPVSGRVTGCFPLVNDDVIDLYERVRLGTRVVMN